MFLRALLADGGGGRRFFAASTALLFGYITRFLDLDEEEFPRGELLQEGLSSAFGLFMVRGAAWSWAGPHRSR